MRSCAWRASARRFLGDADLFGRLARECRRGHARGAYRRLRASDRVKASVKEKLDAELLDHYLLAVGDSLTNLGVLCVGRREDRVTDLRRIEPHRLKALVVEDLQRYPGSSIGAIQERVGIEIPRRRIKSALEQLMEEGRVNPSGAKRGRRYRMAG